MNDLKESDIKYTWELISQFVCWEFCRNANFKANVCGGKQTDLFQFFRDMVIKMTTKTYESDITSQEIAAKFIEELSMLIASSKPQQRIENVAKLGDTLKKLCPQLKPAITELLSTIYRNLFVMKEGGTSNLANNVQLWKNVKAFSVEVNKHLPVPELIKATHSWKKPNAQTTNKPLKDIILARLKKEKITQNEISKIKNSIDNDVLLRMYYDEVSYVPPGSENSNESEVQHGINVQDVLDKSGTERKRKEVKSPRNCSVVREEPDTSEISEIDETPVKTAKRVVRHVSEDTDEGDSDKEVVILKEVPGVQNYGCKNAVVQLNRIKIEDTSDEETKSSKPNASSKKSCPGNANQQPLPVDSIKKEYADIFHTGKRSRVKNVDRKKRKK